MFQLQLWIQFSLIRFNLEIISDNHRGGCEQLIWEVQWAQPGKRKRKTMLRQTGIKAALVEMQRDVQ